MRTVTRTYVKKDGTVVAKTYNYDKKYQKSKDKKVITKKGKLSKRLDKALATIEDVTEREFVKRKIKQFSEEMTGYDSTRPKKAFNLSTFRTMYAARQIDILFENMGTSVDELVKDLKLQGFDVDETWIMDISHWEFRGLNKSNPEPMLTLPDGTTAIVEFHYPDGYELVINRKIEMNEDIED